MMDAAAAEATPIQDGLAQHEIALRKANRTRLWRARAKAEIKAGRMSPSELMADPPEHARKMKVIDLLLATPQVGRTKAMKILRRAGVGPTRVLADLTTRQRSEVLAALPRRR